MSNFADLMPDARIINRLGDDVTYTPTGKLPVTIKAIIYPHSQRIGAESYIPEFQTEIEFMKLAISALPQRDDRIRVNTLTYKVDSITNDDGVFIRVAVRL